MPIDANLPTIDNRRFEDIVAEARTRIPRYTPEWTDLNDNDPGIALVQVFAWMCDLLLYRLGKVPQLNYLKFLQLVGIELQPAEPASAEITFPVQPDFTDPYLIVPAQTQVAAQVQGQDRPVIFETDQSLIALRAALASVQTYDSYSYVDVTATNSDAKLGFAPFGPTAAEGSALLLGFDDPDPFPEIQLDLAVFAVENVSPNRALDCGLPLTPFFSSSSVNWEYWSGMDWRSLNTLKDATQTFLRSGHVVIKTPPKNRMAKAVINGSKSLYWIRARLTRSSYDQPPHLLAVRTNTAPATQAETIHDEVVGGSNGQPNQVVTLANNPVLEGSLVLQVDQGDGPQTWTEVDDFFGSGKNDSVYVLNRTTGEVRFGDGVRGAIPVANVANPAANIVAVEYRFGGGTPGNVTAGLVKNIMVSIPGLAEDKIGNLLPASGARDEETIDQAKERAPATLKANGRAVTIDDFEELAKRVSTVQRAKALPLYHPAFPGVQVPGVVTVVVIPQNDQPNPMPSEGTIRTVCAFLNQRRLLTTEVYVVPPLYQLVDVQASVIVANTADLGEVKTAVEAALVQYFHPLTGGDDGLGWPFGGTIFFSRVYKKILDVPGVLRAEIVTILLDGTAAPECRDVPIAKASLLYSTAHEIQVGYDFGA
jgi:predicted phage baseplate assembly protein